MTARSAPLADAIGRIEALAAALGVSRIALIHIAGGPIAARRIADAFAAGVVTIHEVREMLSEARATAPAAGVRVLPAAARDG